MHGFVFKAAVPRVALIRTNARHCRNDAGTRTKAQKVRRRRFTVLLFLTVEHLHPASLNRAEGETSPRPYPKRVCRMFGPRHHQIHCQWTPQRLVYLEIIIRWDHFFLPSFIHLIFPLLAITNNSRYLYFVLAPLRNPPRLNIFILYLASLAASNCIH